MPILRETMKKVAVREETWDLVDILAAGLGCFKWQAVHACVLFAGEHMAAFTEWYVNSFLPQLEMQGKGDE